MAESSSNNEVLCKEVLEKSEISESIKNWRSTIEYFHKRAQTLSNVDNIKKCIVVVLDRVREAANECSRDAMCKLQNCILFQALVNNHQSFADDISI